MSDAEMTLEQAQAEVERLMRELGDAKALVRELRPVKSKAEPRLCADGCGQMTRGGLFLPGHDAKMRSRLLKAIDEGDSSALDSLLNDYPSLTHGATEESLRERLGSETRRKEAQVEREAETQAKRDAKAKPEAKVRPAPKPKSAKPRVDPIEAQQGTKSPTVTRNGAAIRLAQQSA